MTPLRIAHDILYWTSVAALFGGVVATWLPALSLWSGRLLTVGFVTLTAAIVPRWIAVGHPPIFGTFENSIAAVWFLLVAIGLFMRSSDAETAPALARGLTLWIVPLLCLGWFFDRTMYPLTISERSLLVDIHVLFAWTAHTALLVASTAAILVIRRGTDQPAEGRWDALLFRSVGYGYAALTLMLAVGATYSYLLFGSWYKWEMVESFAAAAWLGYAVVLHAAMTFGWRGRRLAWSLLSVLPLMLGTFWVWSFYAGTYHHFEIPAIKAS